MSLLGMSQNIQSPIQQHIIYIVNDVQWISGELQSLGNPHFFINQDDLEAFNIHNAHISPWVFTGLPKSHTAQMIAIKENTQLLAFPNPDSMEQYRPPLRTSMVILQLPLAIIRGEAPFLSEASLENFLDFYKGTFIPISHANVHYLAEATTQMPNQYDVLYVNRESILSYMNG